MKANMFQVLFNPKKQFEKELARIEKEENARFKAWANGEFEKAIKALQEEKPD